MHDIKLRTNDIIMRHLGVDEAGVRPEASLRNDLNADSLDAIDLMMALEEEFTIEIADSEAEQAATVSDVYALVQRKLQQEEAKA